MTTWLVAAGCEAIHTLDLPIYLMATERQTSRSTMLPNKNNGGGQQRRGLCRFPSAPETPGKTVADLDWKHK
jgi:hypothetical protein